jgi:hypothetical protein
MAMSESKPPRHPLFDPASTYSRMRKSVRPEYKMRGYFHWQKARAIRLGLPLPKREGRDQSQLRQLACRLAGGQSPDLRVTDALDVRPVWLSPRSQFHEGASAVLALVSEADGKRTVGMWAELAEREDRPPASSCRAFLLEPEVLARLGELVQKTCAIGPEKALVHAFAAETVVGNRDIARLLSAVPDLDGEVRGPEIHFRRLPVADEFDAFPPRQGPLTVVLVFEDPAAVAPAE